MKMEINIQWDENDYKSIKNMLKSSVKDDIVFASNIIMQTDYELNKMWVMMLIFEYRSTIMVNSNLEGVYDKIKEINMMFDYEWTVNKIISLFPLYESTILKNMYES